MKLLTGLKNFLIILTLVTSTQVLAASKLDGKTFCRTVQTGGMFGQPSELQHCVQFADGKITDNADTFFGHPLESLAYELIDDTNVVIVRGETSKVEYKYKDDTIVNEVGAILILQQNLHGE